MSEHYWELEGLVGKIAKAHLHIVNQRSVGRGGEYYGPSKDLWEQFVLTYNVIETIHALGFPLDSPRLEKALSWMKYNASRAESLDKEKKVLGRLFLLKTFQYLPGFEIKFNDKLEALESFIEDNLNNDKAKMLPYMSLDSFMQNELKYQELVRRIFNKIENDLGKNKYKIGLISYSLFLSHSYIQKGYKHNTIDNVLKKSISFLNESFTAINDFEISFNDSCYCLLNLGRIDNQFLTKWGLSSNYYKLKEWAEGCIENCNANISFKKNEFKIFKPNPQIRKTLPDELKRSKDNFVNLYMLCILLRSLVASSNGLKDLRIAIPHNLLKIVYENFFDPVNKRFFFSKAINVFLFLTTFIFAFDLIIISDTKLYTAITNFITKFPLVEIREFLYHHADGITAIIAAPPMIWAMVKYIIPYYKKRDRGRDDK